jgi:hypothetical protein
MLCVCVCVCVCGKGSRTISDNRKLSHLNCYHTSTASNNPSNFEQIECNLSLSSITTKAKPTSSQTAYLSRVSASRRALLLRSSSSLITSNGRFDRAMRRCSTSDNLKSIGLRDKSRKSKEFSHAESRKYILKQCDDELATCGRQTRLELDRAVCNRIESFVGCALLLLLLLQLLSLLIRQQFSQREQRSRRQNAHIVATSFNIHQ